MFAAPVAEAKSDSRPAAPAASAASHAFDASVRAILRQPGRPLDAETRAFFEPRFAFDFSQVRIHADAEAARSARAIDARAYTIGRDIVLGARAAGDAKPLMAHELAHVVQQGGRKAAPAPRFAMVPPGSRAEAEAEAAAEAVSQGARFLPAATGGVAVARQEDAGVAAGRAAPAAAARPSVTFDAVTFRGTPNRIAPSQDATVRATVSGLPTGATATIDVDGSGGANGTATITAGAALPASGNVTIHGGAQTTPGNAGKLRLRARVGGHEVGHSAGFTVAAYPINYTDVFAADLDTPHAVGVVVQDGWSSDGGGTVAELDQVELTERVDIQSRDNPPFTSAAGTSATSGTSSYLTATVFSKDSHSYSRADIVTTGLGFGMWRLVYGQLNLFKDKRTGVTDVVIPNSGFTITHVVASFPLVSGFKHMAFKEGAAVTVEGRTATAGGGSKAESKLHSL